MEKRIIDKDWFIEPCTEAGSLWGLELTAKLHDETSQFQHIEVFETRHFGRLLVLDGFVMLTQRDNFIYHEMMTHPALFTHPDPRRVLLIGGGDCGCLRQVLKHSSVAQATQVELDERVTRVSERFFPELCAGNDDPRAELRFGDGLAWVEAAAAASYDVIIVDSTDPIGQAVRLFEAPFYGACRRVLGEEGVLVVQSESPLIQVDLIASIREQMVLAGFGQIRTLQFPQCSYPSGWWSATMAGAGSTLDGFREGDSLDTDYYNAQTHRGALAEPPFLRRALAV